MKKMNHITQEQVIIKAINEDEKIIIFDTLEKD